MNIKEIVENLAQKYGTRDPFLLADELKIKVKKTPLESINLLGLYIEIEKVKVIVCNSFLAPASQQLVVAHELGHAILHENMSLFFIQENTMFATGQFESQANEFAAELLITDDMIRNYEGCTIEEIASAENIHPKLFQYKKFNPLKADF